MTTPAIPAAAPPVRIASSRQSVSFATPMPLLSHMAITMPENAPTLIKPAWPRLSSPEMPTVRLRETAMTTYAQIGTSCPLSERVIAPVEIIT